MPLLVDGDGGSSSVHISELQESRFFGVRCHLIGAGWIRRFRLRREKIGSFGLSEEKFGGFAFGDKKIGGFGTPFVPGASGLLPDPRQLLQLARGCPPPPLTHSLPSLRPLNSIQFEQLPSPPPRKEEEVTQGVPMHTSTPP